VGDPLLTTIEILYEDDALIFVNKPPHLIVQRAYDPDETTLLDLVAQHAQETVFLMQRLDRGTSGVIFFSKSHRINAKLTRQFEARRIRKRYLAIAEGFLGENQTIDAPLARIGAIKFAVRDDGRRAVTHVHPRIATRNGSLLDITLETGRTHQIRVHLASIDHALAGDWLYGSRNADRPMLHAAELEMTHPLTNETLRVAAPPPADFLEELKRREIVSHEGHNVLAVAHVND